MTRYAVTATLAATNDLDPLVDAINKHAANTGVTAKLGATAAEIILTHQKGENIDLTSIMVGGLSSGTFKLDTLDKFGNAVTTADTTLNRGTSAGGAATTFTVKQFTYADRAVGDNETNPIPSFVGKRINKVLFFRNRLAFLAGENVVLCKPGTVGVPNFWSETALVVSANDPIDIACSSTFPSELFDGIDINTGLVVFSTNQQFLLSSDDTVLNPDTAKLRSVSTFNYNETISPISLGTTVAYLDNSGKFSRFNEMANVQREGEPNVCLLYTSPSPRDRTSSRMPSSA